VIPISLDEWSDHLLKSFGEVSLEEVWSPFKAYEVVDHLF
jgi:hypothetical protein